MITETSLRHGFIQPMPELTAAKAAKVIGVDPDTVRRWCVQRLVVSRQVGLRRDWHIDVDDLRRFTTKHNYKFNEALAKELASE